MTRLVVLASGGGTNLQALIDACDAGRLRARVVAVVSDQPEAGALDRAAAHRIAAVSLPRHPDEQRPEYDTRLAEAVAEHEPDWVVMAGFMRLLSPNFLDRFPSRVLNLHPAMPGDLPGVHAIERAFAQHLLGARSASGVMVHLVPDDGVDDGPVLATATVAFESDDTLDTFAARMHAAEHRLLVDTLIALTEERTP